jgi:hypothetical protein
MYTAGPASTPVASAPRLLGAAGVGPAAHVNGAWPRHWTAPGRGEYLAWLDYSNRHGPINTGITAAVKRLVVRCAGSPRQVLPVVMPQSEGWQASTTVRFSADAGASCAFSLLQGFNMSDLARFAHYTGLLPTPGAKADRATAGAGPAHPQVIANGGVTGPLNSARIGALRIAPLAPRLRDPESHRRERGPRGRLP